MHGFYDRKMLSELKATANLYTPLRVLRRLAGRLFSASWLLGLLRTSEASSAFDGCVVYAVSPVAVIVWIVLLRTKALGWQAVGPWAQLHGRS